MEKVRYHEMLPHEIVARRKKFPVAFIGLGGLEWHGEHLAVGNDALKAEKLCELAAARSGGFAFPTLWYGEPRSLRLMEAHAHGPAICRKMKLKYRKFQDRQYGKSGEEQVQFYRQLIWHTLVQMNSLEMKAVCFLCGHYPLHMWAKPVCDEFNKAFKDTKAYAGIEFHYPKGGRSKHVGGDHAGSWETSYLWYLRPDCVDMSIFRGRSKEKLVGVGGLDPRTEASIEIGRKGCDLVVDGMVKKARGLMRRAGK